MQLDDLEALEWPTRVVSYLHEKDHSTRNAFKSSTQLTRLSLILMLGISFTIFIYGLLLDRLSWLFLLLSRNDQDSASLAEFLLVFGYMLLAAGFSYYLFSWVSQQYRVHVMLREIAKSELELEPVLISSRQPVMFARSSSRFIRNVVIQGIKKRFLSLSAHLQLPYNTKFADFHLELLQPDVASGDQFETFHSITVPHHSRARQGEFSPEDAGKSMRARMDGVFQLIALKRRVQGHFLLTNDVDAYSQLSNCLRHRQNEFNSLVSDKRFKYMSIDQVDRGGHAVYKVHLHYKGMSRNVVRRMMRFLEILADTLVTEHEPMLMPPTELELERFQDLERQDVTSRHPSRLPSLRHQRSSATRIREDDVNAPKPEKTLPSLPNHVSSSKSVKTTRKESLQDLYDRLLIPKEALNEIEKLLVHTSSLEVISPTRLLLKSTSPGMNVLHWEMDKANDDVLQLRAQGTSFSFTQSFFINLWRNARQEQWKIDATIPRDLVEQILSDPIVGSYLNNLIPPVHLTISSTHPEMLEILINFSGDLVENIRHAYMLVQELPWLLILLA